MEPNLRRSSTSTGGTRIRLETRSNTTPLFSTQSGQYENTTRQSRPASFLRAAIGLIGVVQEHRRNRVERDIDEDTRSRGPDANRREARSFSGTAGADYRTRRRGYSSRETSPPLQSRQRSDRGQFPRTRSMNMDGTGPDLPSYDQDGQGAFEVSELEAKIARAQEEIDNCSEWLDRNAYRRDVSIIAIEDMTDQLQRHKRRLRRAREQLKSVQDTSGDAGQSGRRRRSRQHSARETVIDDPHDIHNIINAIFGSFTPFAAQSRGFPAEHPFMTESRLFDHLFAEIPNTRFTSTTSSGPSFASGPFAEHFFFANGGVPRFAQQSTGPIPPPTFTRSTQPQVPLRLLTAQEAKTLFKTYNDRWNALSTSDPAIPYPGRALQSKALLALDTISAPMVTATTSEWSREDIIRANTLAFFLGVVDCTPSYTDLAAKIEIDFDHCRATSTQLQQLAEMLKREKVRWHSDKLGRRNNGEAGLNEVLQKDEVARGIFHAVCELGELVVIKRGA